MERDFVDVAKSVAVKVVSLWITRGVVSVFEADEKLLTGRSESVRCGRRAVLDLREEMPINEVERILNEIGSSRHAIPIRIPRCGRPSRQGNLRLVGLDLSDCNCRCGERGPDLF